MGNTIRKSFILCRRANIRAALFSLKKHFPCTAHKINLTVDDLFKLIVIKNYENKEGTVRLEFKKKCKKKFPR